MDQVFFDGLGDITVIGGTVRLDFVTFSPSEKDANGRPQAVFCQRVVMNVDSFLRTAEKMQESAQSLTKFVQASREQAQAEALKTPSPQDRTPADSAPPAPPGAATKPRLFP